MAARRCSDCYRPLSIHAVADRISALEFVSGQVFKGDAPKGVYVIAAGSVRCVRQNPDGREQVLSAEYPCSTIGEVAVLDRGSCFSTIAGGRTELLFLPKADPYRLCTELPTLLAGCIEVLAGRIRAYAELVHTLSLREVDRRVAWFVWNEAVRRGVPTNDRVSGTYGYPPRDRLLRRVRPGNGDARIGTHPTRRTNQRFRAPGDDSGYEPA